jgi:hypothetical protein
MVESSGSRRGTAALGTSFLEFGKFVLRISRDLVVESVEVANR